MYNTVKNCISDAAHDGRNNSTVKIPHLQDYMCGGTNIYVAALRGTLLIVVLNLQ